jgi:hypothetical protein
MKKQPEDYAAELQKAHERWAHIYEHGSSDRNWEDGMGLYLVRNHIAYYRRKIEETMSPEAYPEVYFKALPPEVERNFMARPDEIRAAARASLALYKVDPNYQYIRRHRDDFTPKTRQKLSADNVLGYKTGLEHAIAEDDLVTMRRHENPESYLESFAACARRMQETPTENVQLSLFSLAAASDMDEDFGGMSMQ